LLDRVSRTRFDDPQGAFRRLGVQSASHGGTTPSGRALQAGSDLVRVTVFFVALPLALALTYAALVLVDPLGRVLGVTGTNVIARISGMLLAALAVQFILDGIRESHLFR
jgi:small neutral amino acid transporter SnatA (MarC family)